MVPVQTTIAAINLGRRGNTKCASGLDASNVDRSGVHVLDVGKKDAEKGRDRNQEK